ncbi:hypothetical protein SAMN05444283_1076 [Bacteroides stercoris]|nr:hypothetical protein SAMN05444283_1076 [Bacteroides stercoris]
MKSHLTILTAIQYFGHSIYSIKTSGVHLICYDADILRQTTANLPSPPYHESDKPSSGRGFKSKKNRLLPR